MRRCEGEEEEEEKREELNFSKKVREKECYQANWSDDIDRTPLQLGSQCSVLPVPSKNMPSKTLVIWEWTDNNTTWTAFHKSDIDKVLCFSVYASRQGPC